MHRIRYLIGSLTLLFAVAGAWWLVHLVQHLDDRPGLPLTVEVGSPGTELEFAL